MATRKANPIKDHPPPKNKDFKNHPNDEHPRQGPHPAEEQAANEPPKPPPKQGFWRDRDGKEYPETETSQTEASTEDKDGGRTGPSGAATETDDKGGTTRTDGPDAQATERDATIRADLSNLLIPATVADPRTWLVSWLIKVHHCTQEELPIYMRAFAEGEGKENDGSWTNYGIGIAIKNYYEAIDKELNRANQDQDQGSEIKFGKEPDPYPETINGEELLDELDKLIAKHVVTTPENRVAVVLWIILCYLIAHIETLALLVINSATKRCGKTRLVALIARLVPRPITGVSFSAATIFRLIEKYCPTVVVDEADTMFRDNEELRQLFNGGHSLTDPYVYRCVGDDHEPRRFSVWAPKAIALIGKLPPTVTDRSVIIRLARRAKNEAAARLSKTPKTTWVQLRQKIIRWVLDNHSQIPTTCETILPTIPDVLNDRAEENWVPLLAITELAGPRWSALARKAMETLEGNQAEEDDSPAEYLVHSLQRLYSQRLAAKHKRELFSLDKEDDFHLFSTEIVAALNKDKEAPWGAWKNELTEHALGRMLGSFGVKSQQHRRGDQRGRGYSYGQLKAIFARYPLPKKKADQAGKTDEADGVDEADGIDS